MDISPDTPLEEGIILNIDKPYGYTSTDVVRRIKGALRRLGHRKIKIGHAGTLDPLATGVLLVCIGRATKQVERLQNERKKYEASVRLGATTPSFDLEHPIDKEYPWEHITAEAIERSLETFVGNIEQTPPVYSAKKLDGKRAYNYARKGHEVEMRRVPVTIYRAVLVDFTPPVADIVIECSKGTYVRSIARDLGEKLGGGGHLISLRRTANGGYRAEEALSLDEVLAKLTPNETKKE